MKKLLFIPVILLVFSLMACAIEKPGEEEKAEEQIGRIVTYEDFLSELPKRIDLNDYRLESTKYESLSNYTYTSKTHCEIDKSESNFEVTVDGIQVTLPLTVQDFLNLGFETIPENNTDDPVNLLYTGRSASLNIKTPKGNTFSIYAISKDNTRVPLSDLIVMQITCDFYGDNITYGVGERSDTPEIIFFKKVDGKSTVDSIIKELKHPHTIYFSEAKSNGETTLSTVQLKFIFSDQKYTGNLSVTLEAVRDDTIKRTSYILNFSYLIDYDTIKSN